MSSEQQPAALAREHTATGGDEQDEGTRETNGWAEQCVKGSEWGVWPAGRAVSAVPLDQ